LDELVTRRRQLIETRVAEHNRAEHATTRLVWKTAKRLAEVLDQRQRVRGEDEYAGAGQKILHTLPRLVEKRGIARRLRGFALAGRQPAREGAAVLSDGVPIGAVTSGNFSPTLGHAIALGFVPPDVEPGALVQLDVRGRLLDAQVVAPPFVKK
jgi:hypothetical protein